MTRERAPLSSGPAGVALAGETPDLVALDGLSAADGYFLGLAGGGVPLFVLPRPTAPS